MRSGGGDFNYLMGRVSIWVKERFLGVDNGNG